MAEEDVPNRVTEDDETPHVAVPSHAPLPLPPDISFTRPTLGASAPKPRPTFSQSLEDDRQAHLSQGVQGYGLAITAAVTLAVTLLAFVALGQWLDHRFNPAGVPWFTIVGLLVGIAGGFFNMIRLLTSTSRKK